MMLSTLMRAGYFSCAIAITTWTTIAQSNTDVSPGNAVRQIASLVKRPPAKNNEGAYEHKEAAESEHGDGHSDEHGEEESRVHLNAEQQKIAGIVVETLSAKAMPIEIEAPGEVRLNAYASSQVTPRIEAQIVKRHARLGDTVTKGQKLVTLSSASMAEAQGAALIAAKEWQRLSGLAKHLVSDQRYLEAKIVYQQAQARLLAYGMTAQQTEKLIKQTDITSADGSFSLISPQAGTIIRDDFIIGRMVEPGELLFEITDESSLWVEARVNPDDISKLSPGATARVLIGRRWIEGKLIQVHHALDETTRTLAIRLEIPNPEDKLHPGQFVTAKIQTSDRGESALALPINAVLRSPDGDWHVFIEEEPGEFEPKEVTIIRQLPGMAVIEGLEPGARVVTQGAFFVQSELAKSGFEVHNH
jgi:cobalt-zinc-cadmium efflux system membrane fusion protein